MGNTRKQSFKFGDALVLIRDLTLHDLGYIGSMRSDKVVVKAGAIVEYKEPAITEGNILVQFSTANFDGFNLVGTGIKKDGCWSVDADLFQPYYNPDAIKPGDRFVALTETKLLNGNTIPAGTEFLNERSRLGVNTFGDIYVSYRSNTTGDILYNHVRWYKVAPKVVSVPKKVWGLYDEGTVQSFSHDDELVVVAIRDVGRRELVNTPSTLEENERAIDEDNKAFLVKGQVAFVDFIDLRNDGMGKVRVWHFDHYFNEQDYWNIALDTVVPLLSQATGKPMTRREYEGCAEVVAVEAKKHFIPVGETVTIDGPIWFVVHGEVDDEGPYNFAFRDGDKVYILEVDHNVDDDDDYVLAYRVGHNEDGSGETTWLRPVDLQEVPDDFAECDCD